MEYNKKYDTRTEAQEAFSFFNMVSDWIEEEGFDVSRLRNAIKVIEKDLKPLRKTINEYYTRDPKGYIAGASQYIRPEYEKISGFIDVIQGCLETMEENRKKNET